MVWSTCSSSTTKSLVSAQVLDADLGDNVDILAYLLRVQGDADYWGHRKVNPFSLPACLDVLCQRFKLIHIGCQFFASFGM